MNLRKFFLYLLIVSVAISALLGIGVVLFGNFGDFEARILMTTSVITCMSILGLACGANLEADRGKILPVAGIALSIVSAGLCTYLIWAGKYNETAGKITVTTSLVAAVCAHLSLISLARLDSRFSWAFYVVFAADWILSAILLFILWFEPSSDSDVVARLIGVLGILIAALTIMTPVFHRLSRKVIESDQIDTEIAQLKARIEELERRKAEIA
jgi:hypothetical protein